MSYCTECGIKNRDEARFCKSCGTELESPEIILEQQPASLNESSVSGENILPSQVEVAVTPEIQSLPVEVMEKPIVRKNPLAAGDTLSERYRILSVLESTDSAKFFYEAEDLLRCWSCDVEQSSVREKYCQECGAELKTYPLVNIVAWDASNDALNEQGYVFDGSVSYHVSAIVSAEKAKPHRTQYAVGYQSDTGLEREVDEDSMLILQLSGVCEMAGTPTLGLFVVADGIGGHAAGEVASRSAIRAIAAKAMEMIFIPEVSREPMGVDELAERLKQCVMFANQAVLDIRQENGIDMGCTMTAALLRDDKAIIVNVGDSRTYLLRNGKLAPLTKDHSWVARMIEQGTAKPEEIYTHDKKGVIYRCIGDKPDLEIDTSVLDLSVGDRLLLCCDGVWEMVHDPLMEDTMLDIIDPQLACDRLVVMANQAGGSDNISLIIVNVQ